MQEATIVKASDLKDTPVHNKNNEIIGKAEDVAIISTSGQIAYVVLSFTKPVTEEYKYFAIPWEAFLIDNKHNNLLVLDIPARVFSKAPGFNDRNEWSAYPQQEYMEKIYRHYDIDPKVAQNKLRMSRNMGIGNYGTPKRMEESSPRENHIEREHNTIGNARERHTGNKRHL